MPRTSTHPALSCRGISDDPLHVVALARTEPREMVGQSRGLGPVIGHVARVDRQDRTAGFGNLGDEPVLRDRVPARSQPPSPLPQRRSPPQRDAYRAVGL